MKKIILPSLLIIFGLINTSSAYAYYMPGPRYDITHQPAYPLTNFTPPTAQVAPTSTQVAPQTILTTSTPIIVNGQVTTSTSTQPVTTIGTGSVNFGSLFNSLFPQEAQTPVQSTITTDAVIAVPSDIFIAHLQTPTSTIDVQRFIDPSTSVACYYSEITTAGYTQIIPNCVTITQIPVQ